MLMTLGPWANIIDISWLLPQHSDCRFEENILLLHTPYGHDADSFLVKGVPLVLKIAGCGNTVCMLL